MRTVEAAGAQESSAAAAATIVLCMSRLLRDQDIKLTTQEKNSEHVRLIGLSSVKYDTQGIISA